MTLPLIMPGVIAGALMAFTLSIDDFVITFFTAGAGTVTLPLQIYSMIKIAVTPEVNAVSTLLMLLTLLLIVVAAKLSPTLLRSDRETSTMNRLARSPPPSPPSLASLLAFAPRADARDQLHLYNWNNYIAPETVKRFEGVVQVRSRADLLLGQRGAAREARRRRQGLRRAGADRATPCRR